MIRNGRPYTNESGIVDEALITRHNYAELQKIDMWIRQNIRRSRNVYGHEEDGRPLSVMDTSLIR